VKASARAKAGLHRRQDELDVLPVPPARLARRSNLGAAASWVLHQNGECRNKPRFGGRRATV